MPFPQSAHEKSVLTTSALTLEQISIVFKQAEAYRESFVRSGQFSSISSKSSTSPSEGKKSLTADSTTNRGPKLPAKNVGGPRIVSCLFFEPSTRTRMSFEMAALRLGHHVQLMSSAASSSLSKGESLADTVLNVLAMKPDALVIRYGISKELDELLPTLAIPVLNAGSGVVAHPSQALLDALTIRQNVIHQGQVSNSHPHLHLAGQKVLIVGDVRHSRVASSNFEVLMRLGAEVAVCAPAEFLPSNGNLPSGIQIFKDLDEATAWADVYMALRIQLERHVPQQADSHSSAPAGDMNSARADYSAQFGLHPRRLKILKKNAIIMHPGPINHGVELSIEAIHDPRARIMNQVENGVYIRAALLARALD